MNEKIKGIAAAMEDINLLSNSNLQEENILNLSQKLVGLYPDLQVETIEKLMDDFFRGKKEFHLNKLIRNFTEHLEKPPKKVY